MNSIQFSAAALHKANAPVFGHAAKYKELGIIQSETKNGSILPWHVKVSSGWKNTWLKNVSWHHNAKQLATKLSKSPEVETLYLLSIKPKGMLIDAFSNQETQRENDFRKNNSKSPVELALLVTCNNGNRIYTVKPKPSNT